jgi:hypothetical protein
MNRHAARLELRCKSCVAAGPLKRTLTWSVVSPPDQAKSHLTPYTTNDIVRSPLSLPLTMPSFSPFVFVLCQCLTSIIARLFDSPERCGRTASLVNLRGFQDRWSPKCSKVRSSKLRDLRPFLSSLPFEPRRLLGLILTSFGRGPRSAPLQKRRRLKLTRKRARNRTQNSLGLCRRFGCILVFIWAVAQQASVGFRRLPYFRTMRAFNHSGCSL